jgi:hypothetical protein
MGLSGRQILALVLSIISVIHLIVLVYIAWRIVARRDHVFIVKVRRDGHDHETRLRIEVGLNQLGNI